MATSLPKVAADFSQSLFSSVLAGATTATLNSAADADGNNLASGKYCLTIDIDATTKEYIIADLVGTALTNIQSLSRQGVVTTGFAVYHRTGASVTISDWAVLYRIIYDLTTTNAFDSGLNLGYDAAPAGLTGNNLATVAYVLSVVNGGAVTFDQQVIGGETAGETLLLHDHVYLKEADGKWYKVSASTTTTFQQLKRGIALAAASTNASVTIAISGPITGFSGLTTGSKYYASNSSGLISTSAGTNTVFVGWALSTTILLLSPENRDIPYGNEKDALVGQIGTPSSTNKYLTKLTEFIDIDQSQTSQDSTSAVGEANATTKKNKLAQSFIPTAAGIRGVRLYKAANTGTFTGTVTIALQADSAGSPSGSNLASVTIPNATYLLIGVGDFPAEFSSEYNSLVPGSLYWIVITTSTSDNANHPNLNYAAAGAYANGTLRYNNTTDGWVTIASADLYFYTLDSVKGQVATADPTTGIVAVSALPAGTLEVNITPTSLSTSTVDTTVYKKTLATSTFQTNAGIYLKGYAVFNFNTNGLTSFINIRANGSGIAALSLAPNSGSTPPALSVIYEVYWINSGSTSAQVYIASVTGVANAQNSAAANTNAVGSLLVYTTGTTAIDTTTPVVITISMANGNSNASTSFTNTAVILSKIGT